MGWFLAVVFCGATALLFPLWQSEKAKRRSIQRAHNACVIRSQGYRATLRTIVASVNRQASRGEIPQLARSLRDTAQEVLDADMRRTKKIIEDIRAEEAL